MAAAQHTSGAKLCISKDMEPQDIFYVFDVVEPDFLLFFYLYLGLIDLDG